MSNTIFSGNSRFANDFRSVIDRSVAIASLPLQQLNNVKSSLTDQSTALSQLDGKFSALLSTIASLGNNTGITTYSTSVSSGVVSATVSAGVRAGSYKIEVVSLGASTSTLSKDGLTAVTDPDAQNISAAASYTLTVNGTTYNLTPAATTLNSLADAINSAGANVQATVVNIGSTASPDYRLSVQGTKMAADTIQLNDGTADLLNTLAAGSNASYKLNGMPTAINSDSRTVTLAPGLTVQLLQTSAAGVASTITVSRSSSSLQSALSSFVDAYNAAVAELDTHRGKSGGKLAGNSLLNSLSHVLRDITSYQPGTGAIDSAAALGLVFDKEGKLSLDTTVFNAKSVDDIVTFLGSATGGGFLKRATDALNSVEDASTGLLKDAIKSMQDQLRGQDKLITDAQERVDRLRESLEAQMAAADALIASLEQQANYMNSLFEAMRISQESLK